MEFIFSVAVFGFIVLLLARIVMQMQIIDVKEGRSAKAFFKWVCEDKNLYQGETVTRKELVTIFLLAIIFRLVVYGISAVYYCILSNETNLTIKTVLSLWNRWDAKHYLKLAELGYNNYIENGKHLFLVFLPLYPWLIRLVHVVIADWEISALIISVLAYAVGCCFFYATIAKEYSRSVASKSVVLLSLFPFAFFFGSIMTESLFFATMATGFYFIREHKWFYTGIIGLLCTLCRLHGVIILAAAIVEFLQTYPIGRYVREKRIRDFWEEVVTGGIFFLLIPLGNVIYLCLNYQISGDPFHFKLQQREHWFHTPVYFTKCLKEIVDYAMSGSTTLDLKFCIWIPEICLFVITIIALYYALKRHPLKYTMFLFVYTLCTYSITFLVSGGRYMLSAFPLFIIGGEWCDRHPKAYQWIAVVSSMLMAIYMVGYFQWKQIL